MNNSLRAVLIASILMLLAGSTPAATSKEEAQLARQATPALEVFVYSLSGLSPWVLQAAEAEAGRLLRPASIRLNWINCVADIVTPPCFSAEVSADLIVRFLPKALLQARQSVVGIATSSADRGTAFLFYDRILALQSPRRMLFTVLGRVLAHEITHLLLPMQGHSDYGLMRGHWSMSDLDFTSTACLGLAGRSAQLIHEEALRRMHRKEIRFGK